ncbi:thiamine pyrophosphate-binding protein [Saccharopolyspora sp. NPDC050389]|uniref:thiamine pyrophosphate-binding protein n=1 Tax=Saccharopolyspora sp. NPDC050389 TaxID=3155516 RepID=UPI0033D64E70
MRTGGSLVVESLAALGADTVFGEPGQHALGIFQALAGSGLRYAGFRTELNAGFAAAGFACATGRPAPLLVSTGPGALISLAALQEAASSSVPVIVIGSQVPSAGLGGPRRGFLHELPDQRACVAQVVKSAETARHPSQIPSAIARAWEIALTPPHGPVWVEIPQDVLLAEADFPPVRGLTATPQVPAPLPELVHAAAADLDRAQRPVILAGGGVVRAGAEHALLELAEKLRAPVATTFGAKGAFPWLHPLSAQSWLEDQHTTDFLADADVLLVVGSGLGELSSNYHTFRPRGRVIQVEADLAKLEANVPALGIHADARLALAALASAVSARESDGVAEARVGELLTKIRQRLDSQDLGTERALVEAVRAALPDDAPSFWDMTILAYWAWSAFDARVPGAMQSAQGAGGLGYGFPAALGAAVALGDRRPALAVSGDGGAMYGISELATARQLGLNVTWLIVDDGGYGILREYMTDAFGSAYGTELARPDFVALAESFGVPARKSTPDCLERDLAAALAEPGPNVVVLPANLRMFAPTHLPG